MFFTESDCDSQEEYLEDGDSPLAQIERECQKNSGVRNIRRCLSIETANRLLRERGKVVYGIEHVSGEVSFDSHPERKNMPAYTKRALLINIEPIEKDSPEKILKDLCDANLTRPINDPIFEIIERAHKLLEGE